LVSGRFSLTCRADRDLLGDILAGQLVGEALAFQVVWQQTDLWYVKAIARRQQLVFAVAAHLVVIARSLVCDLR